MTLTRTHYLGNRHTHFTHTVRAVWSARSRAPRARGRRKRGAARCNTVHRAHTVHTSASRSRLTHKSYISPARLARASRRVRGGAWSRVRGEGEGGTLSRCLGAALSVQVRAFVSSSTPSLARVGVRARVRVKVRVRARVQAR
eukprot:scaffold67700_cov63-Phaeocystis_antarctica.AAC.1